MATACAAGVPTSYISHLRCGLGAYISVALCRPYTGSRPLPTANTAPPPGLPDEGVFLGQTSFLTSPLAAQVARRRPGGGK